MSYYKNVFVLLFIFVSSISLGQTNSVQEIRSLLDKAQTDKKVATQIYTTLENNPSDNATVRVLDASATALMALHVGSPMKKLKFAKSAASKLDEIIADHPSHVEARLLRYSIAAKAPKFLGLSKHTDEDIAFLKTNFTKENLVGIPLESKNEYYEIFKESKDFTEEELSHFQQEIQ